MGARWGGTSFVLLRLFPVSIFPEYRQYNIDTTVAYILTYKYSYEKVPASERMRFVFTKPSIYWENGFSKKMYWDLLEMYEQLEEEVVSLTDPTFRRVENVLSDILDANDLGILMDSSKKPRKTG